MTKISKPSSKKTNSKTKKSSTAVVKPSGLTKKPAIVGKKVKVKAQIKISRNYIPKDTEKYMCDKHLSFFKIKLTEWKKN